MKRKRIFSFILIILLLLILQMSASADVGGNDVLGGYWNNYDAVDLDVSIDSTNASIYQSQCYSSSMAWNGIAYGLHISSYSYGDYSGGSTAKIRVIGTTSLPSGTRGLTSNYIDLGWAYQANMTQGPWHHSIVKLSTAQFMTDYYTSAGTYIYNGDNRQKTMTHEIGHSVGLNDLGTDDSGNQSVMWQGATNIPGVSIYPTSHDIANIHYKYGN